MSKRYDLFNLIVLVFVVYAALYIFRTSFVIDRTRYFSLFDDAMISMRYAENFARGHGLVWNPGGERVEGYTNLLWVLYMALLHLLPVAKAKISLLVQVTSAAFLTVNLFFVRRIAGKLAPDSRAVPLFAVLLTAFYLPLNTWSLQGMEVGILALIISGTVLMILNDRERGKTGILPLLILGAGTLIRIDMFIVYGAAFLYLFATAPSAARWKFGVKAALLGALFLALQTGFRLWYYGEPLPNTYYLKMTGYPLLYRVSRGVIVFYEWAVRNNPPFLFFLPFSLLFYKLTRKTALLFAPLAAMTLYSMYVGGDAWEFWGGSNRYISITMPLFFVLFAYASKVLYERFRDKYKLLRAPLAPYAKGFFVVFTLLSFNAIHGARALAEWLLITPPFTAAENKKVVEMGLFLNRITDGTSRIAVTWAGAMPYFAERYVIDLLGKNDKHIAHLPMRFRKDFSKYSNFYPGHLKWDYPYSIEQYKPDVIAQLWMSKEEAEPLLGLLYVKKTINDTTDIYLSKDSLEKQRILLNRDSSDLGIILSN